jgi:hypothetical protein
MEMQRTLSSCLILLLATPLAAQDNAAWPERAFVTLNVPVEAMDNDFSESLSFADSLRRNENVTFGARYESPRGLLFDVGTGVRLTNNVGAGVTLSWLERSRSGSFELLVPNPILANRPLDLAGSVGGLERSELGIHIQGLYALSLGTRTRLMVSGGPTVFVIRQDLVRSIEFEKLPGFTGLTFHDALIAEGEETAIGFNAGADLTWRLASRFGIGAIVRYTRGTATFDPGSESSVSRAIEVRAGGLHIGGGVRVLF